MCLTLTNPTAFKVMALPLSSSSIILSSKKLSFNVSISQKSTQKHLLLSAHFAFRLNEARSQVTARPAVRACNSTTSTYAKDLACEHNFPPNWYMSTFGDGTKKLKSLIAMILIFMQISAPVPLSGWDFWYVSPAKAVLYSPDTKVPRTGELALRKAIPANINMKSIQTSLEDISYLLRIPQRKPYGTMEGNVKKALKIAKDEKDSILASIPADVKETGSTLYASLIDGKGGLQALLQCIKDQDPDRVSVGLASSLDMVAELELLQAPGLSFLLPQQYLKYPRLTGRGTVEFTIEKVDGSTFSPEAGGEPKKNAKIQVVIDGFSAPLTAGNFAKLVVDGAYNGAKLSFTDQAVLTDNGLDKNSGYSVPLEIMPSGQFEPLYRTSLSVQDGELPVLPLSVYGAVAMAHGEVSEDFSAPYQFFFYLYDKRNAGLGGLSFDEGQFSVFGYTTTGREILSQIKSGDIIQSAKLVEGQDRLILPSWCRDGDLCKSFLLSQLLAFDILLNLLALVSICFIFPFQLSCKCLDMIGSGAC